MPKQQFYPLDSRVGWRTAGQEQVSVGDALRLTAVTNGPFGLDDPADSLGGLLLPRGVCTAADGTVYLLGHDKIWWVKRFNQETETFEPLTKISALCQKVAGFQWMPNQAPVSLGTANITCVGRLLYIVLNRFVLVFDRHTFHLRHRWAATQFDPVDIAADADKAYILERQYGRVWQHLPGIDRTLKHDLLIWRKGAAFRWQRIGVDQAGRIYLKSVRRQLRVDPEKNQAATQTKELALQLAIQPTALDIYSATGKPLQTVFDNGGVKAHFAPLAIQTNHHFDDQAGHYISLLKLPCSKQHYTLQGQPFKIDPADVLLLPIYQQNGRWISESLDSKIYHCQWHRVELLLDSLPPGTQMSVHTYTHERELLPEEIEQLNPARWELNATFTGKMQTPNQAADKAKSCWKELLVQSREGRYLWLRFELSGDGFETPAVGDIRVYYPRRSYLNDLPAVFSADDESRWFLERFLSIIQSEWDGIEQRVAQYGRYLDPKAVPAGEHLEWLAQWLAQPLEGSWDGEQKRALLTAVPDFYRLRGTLAGLKKYMQLTLRNISGIAQHDPLGFPQIVEGFQIRQHMLLAEQKSSRLEHGAPMWGSNIVGRLQLDANHRAGEVRLISVGDPKDDYFREYAHQFRLFVPAAWIKSSDDERILRQAIENEKPAHTQYSLCLVEPRFRVGVQSTVGIDSVVGMPPVAILAKAVTADKPSLPRTKRHRLGYDMVLGAAPSEKPGPSLKTETTIGVNSVMK